MTGPTHILDHYERRLARLVQTLDKPNIRSLLRMFSAELQQAEDEAYMLIVERFITTAAGAQLDQWGELVGEYRAGKSDARYRAYIEARLLTHATNGEGDDITAILALLTDSDGTVHLAPVWPAKVQLSFISSMTFDSDDEIGIIERVRDALPAGVGLMFIVQAPQLPFAFDDTPDSAGFDEGAFGDLLSGATIDV